MSDAELAAANNRLHDLLQSRGLILSRDGRFAFVDGAGDYEVESIEQVAKERDELRAQVTSLKQEATEVDEFFTTEIHHKLEAHGRSLERLVQVGNDLLDLAEAIANWIWDESTCINRIQVRRWSTMITRLAQLDFKNQWGLKRIRLLKRLLDWLQEDPSRKCEVYLTVCPGCSLEDARVRVFRAHEDNYEGALENALEAFAEAKQNG
jgi:hypothetical protein